MHRRSLQPIDSHHTSSSKENRRRESIWVERHGKSHLRAFMLGAGTATLFFYGGIFLIFWILGFKFTMFTDSDLIFQKNDKNQEEMDIVMASDPNPQEILADSVQEIPKEEEVEMEDVPPPDIPEPDITEIPIENITISPLEKTDLEMTDSANDKAMKQAMDKVAVENYEAAVPEPQDLNSSAVNANDILPPAAVGEENWVENAVQKSGAIADAAQLAGVKSLDDLMARPGNSLGQKTGKAVLGADLLFEYAKAELKQSSRLALIMVAALIHKNKETRFVIEGHTDSFGGRAYNEKLSLARAQAVLDWLMKNGVPMGNVYVRACAYDSPLVSVNGTEEQQAPNRRVELHMRQPNEKLPLNCINAKDVKKVIVPKPTPQTPKAEPVAPAKPLTTAPPTPPPAAPKAVPYVEPVAPAPVKPVAPKAEPYVEPVAPPAPAPTIPVAPKAEPADE